MIQKQIDEIKARCEAATPAPWFVRNNKSFGVQSNDKNIASCFRRENEVFIAHAREDILQLLEYIEQLQSENAELRARLDKAVELPFKVGDTVYELHCRHKDDSESYMMCVPCDNCQNTFHFIKPAIYMHVKGVFGKIDDFDKTVFLTREEAEQALKERQKQ